MRNGLVLAASAAVVVGLLLWWGREPPAAPQAGMVRDTEVRIAPEIPGRLATIAAEPGTHVAKGDLIAELDVPELAAALGEARAAAAAAGAERDRVFAGARQEYVDTAAEAVRAAEAQRTLAQQVQGRIAKLAENSVESRARLDDADAALAKAEADLALRQAQLDLARAGPTREERDLAGRQVALAQAKVVELEARLAKARIFAPTSGTIGVRVAEPGEVIVPGAPVATLLRDGARWLAFTTREDRLGALGIGSDLALATAGGDPVQARVVELRPLGEFATWRAAQAVDDHDLNSFRLRLDPVGPFSLEAGQFVWLSADAASPAE